MSNRTRSSSGTSLPHCTREADRGVKLSPYVNLSPESPQLPYDSKEAKGLRGLNVHQGQRKLLMSEIQMLTIYYAKKTVHPWLVYVGSAPGTHLIFLHQLFPHVRFSLWDGAPFDTRLKDIKFDDGRPVFELHREFFTDHTCGSILARIEKDHVDEKTTRNKAPGLVHQVGGGKTPLLFVSDIRSAEANREVFEAKVMFDMLAQKRWVTLLRPDLSLLKFRLPFTLKEGDRVPYLDGKLFYGIWPRHESAETRLLVKKSDISKPEIQVDYVTYERVMFHHNAVIRRTCFDTNKAPMSEFSDLLVPGPGKSDIGYCKCYDCLSELCVYNTYLKDAAGNAQARFSKGKLVDLLLAAQAANRDMSKHNSHSNLND